MMLHKAYYSVADAEVDALTDQIDDMPAYTQMLAIICQNFDSCDLMNYNAEYLPEKSSLLNNFHNLLDELGFSYSDEAFYEVMTGTHSVYRKDEDELTDSEDDTYDSSEEDFVEDLAIDTEIDTDDMDESADISDFETTEDA